MPTKPAVLDAGLFTADLSDLKSTETVSVKFHKGYTQWRLTLPASDVSFPEDAAAPYTSFVTINLEDVGLIYTPGNPHWERQWSPCTYELRNLLLVCERELISEKLVISPQVEQAGLAAIVDAHVESADIKLNDGLSLLLSDY